MDAFDKLDAYFVAHPEVSQGVFGAMVGAQQSVVSLWRRRLRKPGLRYQLTINALIGTTTEEWVIAKLGRWRRAA